MIVDHGAIENWLGEAVSRVQSGRMALNHGSRRIDPRDIDLLYDVERLAVAQATSARRQEFASGRVLIRQLLALETAVAVGANGSPLLPAGAHGSLSHHAGVVVAITSRDPRVAAVGIDLATIEELDEAERELILCPEERLLDPMLVFACKEAAYKAWSTLGGRMVDHHEVVVTLSNDREFVATFLGDRRIPGHWSTWDDKVLAVTVVMTE